MEWNVRQAALLLPALALTAVAVCGQTMPEWEAFPDPAPGGGGVGDATVTDPVGDTFGSGQVQHDIIELSVAHDGVDLLMDIVFNDPISPPGSGAPDEVIGLFDIDTDQNAGTGITGGNVSIFCPQSVAFGVDFFVSCGSAGTCDVFDSSFMVVGSAAFSVTSDTLSLAVPLSVISDDGIADVSVVVGTVPEPTDCAPDGGFVTSDLVPVELMGFEVE